jgi:hypothetical protein
MSIHPNIPHPWKPEGLGQIVALSKETNRSISRWILEAAQPLGARSQALSDPPTPQEN